LEPDTVIPSVELLRQLLSLKGGLSEERLDRLRRIVDHVVQALVKELATRLRPALIGSVVSRPTRRKGGPVDLRRTVAANLRTVRFRDDGSPQLRPDSLVFKTRARRSFDWRVILVVDVSGSMEDSVIYSALMAAILSGLPAVTTHFVAFSTRVVDLSDRVHDPLGLLLEVVVGGGTDIARALRYARRLMTAPSRTLLILVTDFEEGGPVPALLAEVRAIAETGAHPIGLAALDDRGAPHYTRSVAEQVVAAGMPVAALTPLELARWVSEQIH
jgi:Mg-chelatase subunit ChlD